jgi:Holliday junction resolvase RusA-like endonuclease
MFLFEIHSEPIPQKQTQFSRGHAYDPSHKDRLAIQWQARPYAPKQPFFDPCVMDLTFYMPIPKATSGVRRRQMCNHIIHHVKRPDVDNLAYLVTNALKGIFYVDDSQITDLTLHKRYSDTPKTVVKITPLEQIAPTRGEQCE